MLRFVCPDGEAVVPKSKEILAKLRAFETRPELAEARSYKLRCKARVGTLNLFLSRVYDESEKVTITKDNFVELRSLSRELGFAELDEELRAFEDAEFGCYPKHQNLIRDERVNDSTRENKAMLRLLSVQYSMLQQLASRFELLEQKVTAIEVLLSESRKANTELRESLEAKITSLEIQSDEVSRKTEQIISEYMKRSDAENLSRDVAQLKELEKRHENEIRDIAIQTRYQEGRRFGHHKAKPLSGIIAYLTRECGGNVHEKEIIKVTASSVYGDCHPKNAVDLETDSIYQSRNEQNTWLCYDFKDRRVIPTSYSVKSFRYGPGSHHLKSWVLEVSNTGTSWKEVDRRDNNNDLNDAHVTRNFRIPKIASERSRFVRLRQIGPNHRLGYYMGITAMEIFGILFDQ